MKHKIIVQSKLSWTKATYYINNDIISQLYVMHIQNTLTASFIFSKGNVCKSSLWIKFGKNICFKDVNKITFDFFDLFRLLSSSKLKLGGWPGVLNPNAKTKNAQSKTPTTGTATCGDTTSVNSIILATCYDKLDIKLMKIWSANSQQLSRLLTIHVSRAHADVECVLRHSFCVVFLFFLNTFSSINFIL